MADIADPIGPAPSAAVDPERYRSWQLADAALGHPDRSRDPNQQSDAQLRAAIAAWDASYAEAPTHVGDELARARRDLRSAAYARRSALTSVSDSLQAIQLLYPLSQPFRVPSLGGGVAARPILAYGNRAGCAF